MTSSADHLSREVDSKCKAILRNMTTFSHTATRVSDACDFCRKRKVKCHFEPGALHCNQCESRNKICTYERAKNSSTAKKVTQEASKPQDLVSVALQSASKSFVAKSVQSSTESGSIPEHTITQKIDNLREELQAYKKLSDYWQSRYLNIIPRKTSPELENPHAQQADLVTYHFHQYHNNNDSADNTSYGHYNMHERLHHTTHQYYSDHHNTSPHRHHHPQHPHPQDYHQYSNNQHQNSRIQFVAQDCQPSSSHIGSQNHSPANVTSQSFPFQFELLPENSQGHSVLQPTLHVQNGMTENFYDLEYEFNTRVELPTVFLDQGPSGLPPTTQPSLEQHELDRHRNSFLEESILVGAPQMTQSSPDTDSSLFTFRGQTLHLLSPELVDLVSSAYYDLVALEVSYYQHLIIDKERTTFFWKCLTQPLHMEDPRVPEDIHDASPHSTIIRASEAPLEFLLSLFEHSICWMEGASVLELTDLAQILGSNAEKLMFSIIFERKGCEEANLAARLVNALTMMVCYYRASHRLAAALSTLTIAHHLVIKYQSVIAPVVADRLQLCMLFSSANDQERTERLQLIYSQRSLTSSLMVSFFIMYIVSKMRTSAILTPHEIEDLLWKISEIDRLLLLPPACTQPSRIWFKAVNLVIKAELACRYQDFEAAKLHLREAEEFVEANYSSALVFLLLVEIRNFIKGTQAALQSILTVDKDSPMGVPLEMVKEMMERILKLRAKHDGVKSLNKTIGSNSEHVKK